MSHLPYLIQNLQPPKDFVESEVEKDSSELSITEEIVLGNEDESTITAKEIERINKLSEMKDQIERRYRRLSTSSRRSGLEYMSSDSIKEVFYDYVKNKEDLERMTSSELQDLYDRWYSDIYLEALEKE